MGLVWKQRELGRAIFNPGDSAAGAGSSAGRGHARFNKLRKKRYVYDKVHVGYTPIQRLNQEVSQMLPQ